MVQIIHVNGLVDLITSEIFISHMVQIILIQVSGYASNDVVFISHMVQIIPVLSMAMGKPKKALYPTWFR